MKIVGLCGGSGSGKGMVSSILTDLGYPVVDTDEIYHSMITHDSPCLRDIRAEFGDGVITDGILDRRKLSNIVFSGKGSEARLSTLNSITHRHVLDKVRDKIEALRLKGENLVCVDIPLLFESGFDKECDVTVCVLADRETRIERIVNRDGIDRDRAIQRINAQVPDDFLKDKTDFSLENNSTHKALRACVKELINKINEDKKMSEKSIGQQMLDNLSYRRKNIYEESTPEKIKKIYDYSVGYMKFLDDAKTEREATVEAIKLAESFGFSEYKIGDKISVGDKKYLNQHGKSVLFFKVGENDIEKDGIRILASHIDSPRLDLKQVPMYEDSGMGFLKTHYYGGVKKYQWTAIPLALHGVMVRADGETVEVKIGEDDTDPVFYINDLLPHLGQKQMGETLANAINGETLNILIGGLPYDDKEVTEKIKLTALSLLNDKYGVTEEDFISAELSLVPAFKARDIGFDRALIGAYGHDDRVCSYPAITALFDNEDTKHTVVVVLADKEEIGSLGVTGMQSDFLIDVISEIASNLGANPAVVRSRSKCLSADVNAAYDPNFSDVYEKRNSAMISCGTTMSKYTGARGKSGTSDASAEFVGFVRKLFADNGVIWQTAELGKVDAGGGGTVAMYIANHNIETVDLGVPVISMHAPYEVVSKADVYSTYEAFCAFIK